MVHKIIQQLLSISGLRIECPNCNEEFPIRKAKLFSMYDTYPPAVRKLIDKRSATADDLTAELKERKNTLAKDRKKKPEKITVSAQASNFGKISEQILPAFLTFPYRQNECRALFEPVDYIVFRNLLRSGRIDVIKFVDVKTGGGRLTTDQKRIRNRIVEGEIKHKVIG